MLDILELILEVIVDLELAAVFCLVLGDFVDGEEGLDFAPPVIGLTIVACGLTILACGFIVLVFDSTGVFCVTGDGTVSQVLSVAKAGIGDADLVTEAATATLFLVVASVSVCVGVKFAV